MGDIARAYASPASSPAVAVLAFPSGGGDDRNISCPRAGGVVVSGGRRNGRSGGSGSGVRLAGGFVAPGGGVFCEGRPQMRRKRASSAAAAAASTPSNRPVMIQAQGQHQHQQGGQRTMSWRNTASAAVASGVGPAILSAGVGIKTGPSPLGAAGASAADTAADTGVTATASTTNGELPCPTTPRGGTTNGAIRVPAAA
ncbi:unnamed protein product, partial [Laminaria digitata]